MRGDGALFATSFVARAAARPLDARAARRGAETRVDAPENARKRVAITTWIYLLAVLTALALAVTGERTDKGLFALGSVPFAFGMIGGVMARSAFKGRVTIGYVAAIVAASNAGGAWSVVGDTTTTMMWIDGVKPLWVARGFLASVTALLVFGFLSANHQNKTQPMV